MRDGPNGLPPSPPTSQYPLTQAHQSTSLSSPPPLLGQHPLTQAHQCTLLSSLKLRVRIHR
jgi:hypothetical protein